jgi:hypothetical protein
MHALAASQHDRLHGTHGIGMGSSGTLHSCHVCPSHTLPCLLSGHVSPGSHAFLTGSLTEHGLRRLAKVIDGALQAVHAILLDQVGWYSKADRLSQWHPPATLLYGTVLACVGGASRLYVYATLLVPVYC